MNKQKMIWITILGFFVIYLGSVLIVGHFFSKNENISKVIASNTIQKLKVSSEIFHIQFHTSKDQQIHVSLSGRTSQFSKPILNISVKNQVLEIHGFDQNIGAVSLRLTNSIALHIYLPDQKFHSIEIVSEMSSISSNQTLKANLLTIKSGLGRISLQGFKGQQLIASSDIGTITIGELDSKIYIESNSGNIKINNWTELKYDNQLHTTRGSIEVGVKQVPNTYYLSLVSNGFISTNININRVLKQTQWKMTGINQIEGYTGNIKDNRTHIKMNSDTGKIVI
ncbi:DUF4097 family beta strand repeat-containing protein [Thermoflavimicrobium daqui]|nr:DUF4097 family beta strand repeat-containing protein [Thermoflavimicrobium daqui]